jgi:hypothetical protein
MIFNNRDKENWNEKINIILKIIKNGRIFIKWKNEKINNFLLELD